MPVWPNEVREAVGGTPRDARPWLPPMTRMVDIVRLLSSEAVSQTRLVDRSGVLLDAEALRVFSVNDTGMCLIEALQSGVDDHEGLVRRLMEEFAVDAATAAGDVDAFVEELARHLDGGRS